MARCAVPRLQDIRFHSAGARNSAKHVKDHGGTRDNALAVAAGSGWLYMGYGQKVIVVGRNGARRVSV